MTLINVKYRADGNNGRFFNFRQANIGECNGPSSEALQTLLDEIDAYNKRVNITYLCVAALACLTCQKENIG